MLSPGNWYTFYVPSPISANKYGFTIYRGAETWNAAEFKGRRNWLGRMRDARETRRREDNAALDDADIMNNLFEKDKLAPSRRDY
jgi:hypothetical protein